MNKFIGLSLLSALICSPVFADCSYPKAPAKLPDGNSAALEEMMTAKKAVEQYVKDMDAYLSCIGLEYDGAVAKQGAAATEDQKKQMAAVHAQKNNAAIDERDAVAARFNDQVRAYKAKHPPQ